MLESKIVEWLSKDLTFNLLVELVLPIVDGYWIIVSVWSMNQGLHSSNPESVSVRDILWLCSIVKKKHFTKWSNLDGWFLEGPKVWRSQYYALVSFLFDDYSCVHKTIWKSYLLISRRANINTPFMDGRFLSRVCGY